MSSIWNEGGLLPPNSGHDVRIYDEQQERRRLAEMPNPPQKSGRRHGQAASTLSSPFGPTGHLSSGTGRGHQGSLVSWRTGVSAASTPTKDRSSSAFHVDQQADRGARSSSGHPSSVEAFYQRLSSTSQPDRRSFVQSATSLGAQHSSALDDPEPVFSAEDHYGGARPKQLAGELAPASPQLSKAAAALKAAQRDFDAAQEYDLRAAALHTKVVSFINTLFLRRSSQTLS